MYSDIQNIRLSITYNIGIIKIKHYLTTRERGMIRKGLRGMIDYMWTGH